MIDLDLPWRALGIQPRSEIAVSGFISDLDFICYCPSYKMVMVHRGKKRETVVPFIHSYIFVRFGFDAITWHQMMNIVGVNRILLGRVAEEEILQLRHQVGDGTGVLSYEVRKIFRRINVGDRITLCNGVFAGTDGVVETVDDELQVGGINISLLGREIVVNQPLAWCEKSAPATDGGPGTRSRKRHRNGRLRSPYVNLGSQA
jgi:transcription antitermination factor NusG